MNLQKDEVDSIKRLKKLQVKVFLINLDSVQEIPPLNR